MPAVRYEPHLRRGEIVASVSALVLLIALFAVHWLTGAHHVTQTGFAAFPVLRFFLLIAGLLGVLITVTQVGRAPALPAALDMVTLTFGALTTLLLIIRLLFGSDGVGGGAIIGLIACGGVTAGAFMALRAEDGWIPGPEHPVQTLRVGRAPGV